MSENGVLEAGHSFLATLFGIGQYERWCAMKKTVNISADNEFVKWLLDAADDKVNRREKHENAVQLTNGFLPPATAQLATHSTIATVQIPFFKPKIQPKQLPKLLPKPAQPPPPVSMASEPMENGIRQQQPLHQIQLHDREEDMEDNLDSALVISEQATQTVDEFSQITVKQELDFDEYKESWDGPVMPADEETQSNSCSTKMVRAKLLECESCHYTTIHRFMMRQHKISKHLGTKPYQCHDCKYSTVRLVDLARHCFNHTHRLKCVVCDFFCINKIVLKEHMHEEHKASNSTILNSLANIV